MPKKVCHISTVHNLFDTRIFYKECDTLAKEGYEVYLIINVNNEDLQILLTIENVKVYFKNKKYENLFIKDNNILNSEMINKFENNMEFIKVIKYLKVRNIKIIPIIQVKSRLKRFLFNSIIAFKKAFDVNAELYHFHDPELIFTGLLLKILKKKVIYDVHEDVSKQILNKDYLKFFKKIIAFLFESIEKTLSNFFNSIITATDSINKRFKKALKRKDMIVLTIKNVPILNIIDSIIKSFILNISNNSNIIINSFDNYDLEDNVKNINYKNLVLYNKVNYREIFYISYAGGLNIYRGIKELIQAIEIANERIKNLDSIEFKKIKLILMGKWQSDKYKNECMNLKAWRYVEYKGFLKPEEVYKNYLKSMIGITVLYPRENYFESLPIKAFEYMACFLPMVMSKFKYWEEIFGSCALFVNPFSPEDIAEKIVLLLKDRLLREKLAQNGRKLIEEKFSWEKESMKLIKLYNKLLE